MTEENFLQRLPRMNTEWEAWQDVVKECKLVGIDMNDPRYLRMVKAISVWGEHLYQLRAHQPAEQVQGAFESKIAEYERARLENQGEAMRSTLDLIQELRDEATGEKPTVALVVGFETSTSFVFASDPDPLSKLNGFVIQGGTPVGFLRLVRTKGKVTVAVRPLDEFKGDQGILRYLESLSASFAAQMEASGLGKVDEQPS